ncbi:glutathione S-transferase domain-containing protein [Novosphingobium flavum]|uniref:Glutathione S-transferase domain-containing protein n=1 Tax=Novosphingobium flavum TaxID=1778672 RepID=A0A7X1KLR3_9SPHN|nr:glutathione S-transferase domain-containing protein [Novosphingobium flavum]MBC2665864.1 glutathione S-transferase domain-containing protein [Novosphingobium flavum]
MTDFKPVLYLKAACPHCFRTRLFLLDSGQLDRFETREFVPGEASEAAVRAELAPHFAKPTYPTVQYAPGQFQNESADIIARYSEGLDPDRPLPVFRAWLDGIQPKLAKARSENKLLRAALDKAGANLPEGVDA